MAAKPNTPRQRWRAVETRDARARSDFVYAVKTTGVYCRPGCPSRAPKRENVVFFDTPQEARAAGFRPCLRCRPDEAGPPPPADPRVLSACRLLEQAEQMPTLAELAQQAGLSRHHFLRLFKKSLGVTPKQYGDNLRLTRFRQGLADGRQVAESLYRAGYGSASRLYEAAGKRLGLAPASLKQGGRGLQIHYALADCFLGPVLVAATPRGICAIELGDSRAGLVAGLEERFSQARLGPGGPEMDGLVQGVLDRIEHPASLAELPLHICGTALQELVWRALQAIPPGQTTTYAELAAGLGRPNSARAVANAVAANRLAVVVPCHRVVRKDGGLGGYRWGVARKAALLKHEKKPD